MLSILRKNLLIAELIKLIGWSRLRKVRLGKPLHDINFLISMSSVLILLGVQIQCTRTTSALTQEILCCQETKLSKLVYCLVKVCFL